MFKFANGGMIRVAMEETSIEMKITNRPPNRIDSKPPGY